MKQPVIRQKGVLILVMLALAVVGVMFMSTTTARAADIPTLMQTITPDGRTIVADSFSRLNFGAIIAGAIVALIVELALNLLGIGLGATTINPRYGEDSATPQQLTMGAIFWIAVSTLISLFVGGYLAARFAGLPSRTDGVLHGIVTWALVMLVSMFLLSTTVGRIVSGTATLLGQGIALATSAVGGVARGAAGVVSSVAQGAGTAVQGLAQGAGNAVQTAAEGVQDAVESRPEVANALRQRDQLLQSIMEEGRNILRQAGIDPNQVQGTVQNAAADVRNAAQRAAQNPTDADRIFNDTLARVLNRAQGVANQADRDAVVRVLAERGNMSREQAQAQLKRWEDNFDQVRMQTEQTCRKRSAKLMTCAARLNRKLKNCVWQQIARPANWPTQRPKPSPESRWLPLRQL